MSRWDRSVTETVDDATRFWAEASRQTLEDMMAPRWAWEAWLRVAAGVIVSPGSVFEPGCGVGLLADALPPGCTYYGCDVNAAYVEEARRTRVAPGVDFSVRDFQDVLASGETFDWVVVTSLFGMFPEAASYELIPGFWALATRGLSVTTVDKRLFATDRRLRFDFTAHDPDDLLAAGRALPGVGRVELHHGREFPELRGHHTQRGLALYSWRQGEVEARG